MKIMNLDNIIYKIELVMNMIIKDLKEYFKFNVM